MIFKQDGTKPIYVQISEWIETEILSGALLEDQKVFSQYQLAEMFQINPATAAKGLNLLADEAILYKKRGLGMFVAPNAKQFILEKRKNQTMKNLVSELVMESERLGVSEEELLTMIRIEKEKQRGNHDERS
ncbi:GntR family transcriptional regulator [Ferdinandcohnia sp. Marseille-Q9671]